MQATHSLNRQKSNPMHLTSTSSNLRKPSIMKATRPSIFRSSARFRQLLTLVNPASMDAKTNSRSQASGLSRLILQSALATALLLIGNVAMGQTNTWDGSSSNNWNTPANWSLNQVPTSAHDVVIDINANISVNTGSITINSLAISNGASVTLTASGSARTITIDNNGSFIESGSTLTLQGQNNGGTRTMTWHILAQILLCPLPVN